MIRTRSIQLLQNVARRHVTTSSRDRKGERCINQVQLLGRIGSNPVVRGENNNVVTFSLATNEYYKSSGEDGASDSWKQIPSWHNITVFKPGLRDVVSAYCKSGDRVMVTGRITYRKWEDENQKTVSLTSIVAEDLIFFRGTATTPSSDRIDHDEDDGFIDQGFK